MRLSEIKRRLHLAIHLAATSQFLPGFYVLPQRLPHPAEAAMAFGNRNAIDQLLSGLPRIMERVLRFDRVGTDRMRVDLAE